MYRVGHINLVLVHVWITRAQWPVAFKSNPNVLALLEIQ